MLFSFASLSAVLVDSGQDTDAVPDTETDEGRSGETDTGGTTLTDLLARYAALIATPVEGFALVEGTEGDDDLTAGVDPSVLDGRGGARCAAGRGRE